MPAPRVLLVSMPHSLAYFPNLALGLLKPAVEAIGHVCDVRYFSLDFVVHVGDDVHAALTDVRYYNAQIGEWVFEGVAHGRPDAAGTGLLTEVFAAEFAAFHEPGRMLAFLSARAAAAGFIDACYAGVEWQRYDIVAFTSSFQQTMASLALARRIRAEHPGVFIVMGGANCQDEMGAELHRQYRFLDAVCQGEGDRAFPELLRRHAIGADLRGIPGMVVRIDGQTIVPDRSTDSVADLDGLPIPDFDAFFAQHAAHGFARRHPPALVFETARGCWWGQKQHCTFCGLNGVTMAYRAKSQDRALAELEFLVRRHGTRDVANADNILAMDYFEQFVPRLAESGLDLLVFYETKSNLRPWQWSALGRAGIRRVQAGIESLDTDILRLMRKGVSGIQNVMALKLAAEAGVYVEWLNLCGFPGETADSYVRQARLMKLLIHLQPPAGFYRARADRFSPYHTDPGRFGVTLEPLPAYRHIYPLDAAAIERLGYHFIMRSEALDRTTLTTAPAEAQSALWQRHHKDSALFVTEMDDGELVVRDERWGFAPATVPLYGAEAAMLALCWQMTSWRAVCAALGARFDAAALAAAAAALEAHGFMIREGALLLSLPLRQPGFRRAPAAAELRGASWRPYAQQAGAMERPRLPALAEVH